MSQLNYKCFMKSMILLILTALLHPHAATWWACVPFCLPLPTTIGIFPIPPECPPGMCIPPLVWMGACWASQSVTEMYPEPQGAERGPEVCLLHFDTLKLPSGGLLALTSSSFSLCLFVCPSLSTTSNGESR